MQDSHDNHEFDKFVWNDMNMNVASACEYMYLKIPNTS